MKEFNFDIIVPVYNSKAYLDDCILSVINQTYKNWNLYLIDDGSTDDSLRICNDYAEKHPNIHVMSKTNEGQGVARNVGMSLGKGEYITFLDSDDYLKEDYLQQANKALSRSEAEVLCHNIEFVKEKKNWTVSFYKDFTNFIGDPFKVFMEGGKVFTGACGKFIARSFIEKYKLQFPAFRAREDTYFLAVLFSKNPKTTFSNIMGYVVRIRENSTETSAFNFNKTHLLDASEYCVEYAQKYRPEVFDVAIRYHLDTCFVVALEMPVEERKEDKPSYDRLVNSFAKYSQLSKDQKIIKEFELFKTNRARFFKKEHRKEFIRKVKTKLCRK